MKRWLKVEALPLLIYIVVIGWMVGRTSLALWEIAVSFAFFTLIPVLAALFYGHAVGGARYPNRKSATAGKQEVSC